MERLLDEALAAIKSAESLQDLQKVKNQYLSKKGELNQLMTKMKELDPSERPAYGAKVNQIKQALETAFSEKEAELNEKAMDASLQEGKLDLSLQGQQFNVGTIHPLVMVQEAIEDFFIGMGYAIEEGPELEKDYYNFERANIPQDHPARDMQDTFYINQTDLLRTHTTAIQTRVLEKSKGQLPIKVICPGKVYRNDDDDATHSHQFVQIEALVVDKHISMADLKGTLDALAKFLFGQKRTIRFRPSYFQFTEPSVEVDVSCHICGGKGCPTCKHTGWIEVLGAGMVHPAVLEMAGYDPKEVSGFAFGLGVERVALLKYGIDDIRQFYTNDLRFLETFRRFE